MYQPLFKNGCLIVLVLVGVHAHDDYISEAANSCHRDQDMLSCGKYKFLRLLDSASSATVLETNTSYPVQLVRIDNPDESGTFFSEGRANPDDSEFSKMLGFLQKRADRFLRTQGVTVPLPEGFRVIEDEDDDNSIGRGRVQKKKGLISLLTLFGVFKVKVLLSLVLVSIFLIKKVFFIGALILPSILHSLKAKCAHVLPPHHVGHSGHGEEYHDDYYGNYGHSGYNKEWERKYRIAAAAAQAGAQGGFQAVTM